MNSTACGEAGSRTTGGPENAVSPALPSTTSPSSARPIQDLSPERTQHAVSPHPRHSTEHFSTLKLTPTDSLTLATQQQQQYRRVDTEVPADARQKNRFPVSSECNNDFLITNRSAYPALRLDTVILDALLSMSRLDSIPTDVGSVTDIADHSEVLGNSESTQVADLPGSSSQVVSSQASHASPVPAWTQSTMVPHQAASFCSEKTKCEETEEEGGLPDTQQELRTPAQRRVPALNAYRRFAPSTGFSNNGKGKSATRDELMSMSNETASSGSMGLVSTARTPTHVDAAAPAASRSPTNRQSARPHTMPSGLKIGQFPRGKTTTKLTTTTDPVGTVAAVVESPQWQRDFALHAQQILRDYEKKAAREAQRADQLANAVQVLEGKLAAVEHIRRNEETTHKATVKQLSRQVLELDSIVGNMRRTKNDLERQLEEARNTTRAQERVYQAERTTPTQPYEVQLKPPPSELVASEPQRQEKRESVAQERLASNGKVFGEDHRGQKRLPFLDTATPTAAESRVDASTNTEADAALVNPMANTSPESESPLRPNDRAFENASSHTCVLPDVLAQQQLREQTLMSQLSLLEKRLQQEVEQRRQSEQQVVSLMMQNEALREAAASAAATPSPAFLSKATHEVDNVTSGATPLNTQLVVRERSASEEDVAHEWEEESWHNQRQKNDQHALSQKLQREYEALQKESSVLLHHYKRQQDLHAQQLAAVRSHLRPVLSFVGVELDHLSDHLDDVQNITVALEKLFEQLKQQKHVDAVTNEHEREVVRLTTMQQALAQADRQNDEHRTRLEATEAQLQRAQHELALWQQQQDKVMRQQHQRDNAWRAAEAQYKSAMGLLKRALREYTRSLPRTFVKDTSIANIEGAQICKDQRQNTAGRPAASSSLLTGSEHVSVHNDNEDEKNDITKSAVVEMSELITEDSVSPTEARGHNSDVASAATSDNGAQKTKIRAVGASVTKQVFTKNNTTAIEDDLDVSPMSLISAIQTTTSTNDSFVLDDKSVRIDFERDMVMLHRDLQKLLTAWRTRQHTLLESNKHWKQKANNAASANAALLEKTRLRERHLTQQLRLLRSSEQQRLEELEVLRCNWAAVQEQQAVKHTQELRNCKDKAVRERETLLRRIQLTEERLHHTESVLSNANEESDSLKKAVRQLREAEQDAVAAREQTQRQQLDLNVHIEDLEDRLRNAQHVETGLRALLTTSVSALARTMLTVRQLRLQCKALHALRGESDCLVEAFECALAAVGRQTDVKDNTAGAEMSTTLTKVVPSHLSMLPFTVLPFTSHLLIAARLRVVALTIIAVHRLRRLSQNRRGGLDTLKTSSPFSSSAPARSYQPLGSVFALWGVSALMRPSSDLTSACCVKAVLPDVQLPKTHELVTPILPLLPVAMATAADNPGRSVSEKKVQFEDANEDDCYINKNNVDQTERMHPRSGSGFRTAEATQTVLLEHLLSVTQLDIEAPCTHFALAAVSASERLDAYLAQAAQQSQLRRAALTQLRKQKCVGAEYSQSVFSLIPPQFGKPLLQLLSLHSLQRCQLQEVQSVVQKLVAQNQRLVSAVETQAQLDETRLVELDALTAQAARCAPQQEELMSLQEKLVQSHASLLQERQMRREAEKHLADLRQQQLQWMAEEESLKREVYVLNMELANTTSDAQPSTLKFQRDGVTARGTPSASGTVLVQHTGTVATSESTSVFEKDVEACTPVQPGDSKREAPSPQCLTEGNRGSDDKEYYRRLLRGPNSSDEDGKTGTAALRYKQRHNIPTIEELTHLLHASPHRPPAQCTQCHDVNSSRISLCCDEAAVDAPKTSGLELFVPKVIQEQQQKRQSLRESLATEEVKHPESNSSKNSCPQGGSELATSTSPETTYRVVISPSQTKHHKTHNKRSVDIYGNTSAPEPLSQHRHTSPANSTRILLSTRPTLLVEESRQHQQLLQSLAVSASSSFSVSNARQSEMPLQQRQQQYLNGTKALAQQRQAGFEEKHPVALAKVWAPSNRASTLSTIRSDPLSSAALSNVSRSVTAPSAESHLAHCINSSDVSERSVTQPQPAERPSASVPLVSFSSSSASTSSLSSLLSASRGAAAPHRTAEANREGSPVGLVSGPMYFTKRPT